jgi:hypothetical protein
MHKEIFRGIATGKAEDQLSYIKQLRKEISWEWKELKRRPGMVALFQAKGLESQVAALDAMSPKTKDDWSALDKKRKYAKELISFLYTNSPHQEVHEGLRHTIDKAVGKLSKSASVPLTFFQDFLHLSTAGGRLTRERPDAYHLAYEFNLMNENGYRPACPWNPAEIVYEAGLTKVYAEETHENNLTELGSAVLMRLNETLGPPKAAELYKIPVVS